MIIVRSLATFQADFPDDGVDDGSGIMLYSGKNVAEVVRDILVANDCTTPELSNDGVHGWELTFAYRGYPLWMQVVRLDHFILECKEGPRMGDGSTSAPHLKVLLMLNEELRRDGRFHDLLWYRQRDYLADRPGSELPVEQNDPSSDGAKPKQGIFKSILNALLGRPESDG